MPRARRTCGAKVRDPARPDEPTNCPTLAVPGGDLCAVHKAERERLRGTRQERGYGAAHTRRRRLLMARLRALAPQDRLCPICKEMMLPSDDLEAEHSDPLVDHSDKRTAPLADRLVHAACNPRGGAR